MYNKDNPFLATIIKRQFLTPKNANKSVAHIELNLEGSNLSYEAGDCVGVFAPNDPQLIEKILAHFKDLPALVPHPKTQVLLSPYEMLKDHFSLNHLSRELLGLFESYANTSDKSYLAQILTPPENFLPYTQTRDLLDVLLDFPSVRPAFEEILPLLRRLVPRLYSIASDFTTVGPRADLLVRLSESTHHERLRQGVASHFLTHRAPLHEAKIPIFLTHSTFKLPKDPSLPVILIGPGTGIAPYRGFVQANAHSPSPRKIWIFFGEQHANHFFYQAEWEDALKRGTLERIDCAFSRDQAHKIYVQDRLWENKEAVFQWIENGASVYLCGDAHAMAPAVDHTLGKILAWGNHLHEEEGAHLLKEMRRSKRYLRDVY